MGVILERIQNWIHNVEAEEAKFARYFKSLLEEGKELGKRESDKFFARARTLVRNLIQDDKLNLAQIRKSADEAQLSASRYKVFLSEIYHTTTNLAKSLNKKNKKKGSELLKQVGEYSAYEITQLPVADLEVETETLQQLIQLTCAQVSPDFFIEVSTTKSQTFSPYITEISNHLKQPIGRKGNLAPKLEEDIHKLKRRGWFSRVIGFFTGENEKLRLLEQFNGSVMPVIGKLAEVVGDQSKEAVRLKKQREIDKRKNKIIQTIQLDNLPIEELKTNLAFFNYEAAKSDDYLNKARAAIIAEIKTRISQFIDPQKGLDYLEQLSQLNTTFADLFNEEEKATFDCLISDRREQCQSWKDLRNFKHKVISTLDGKSNEEITSKDINQAYKDAITLLQKNHLNGMDEDVNEVIDVCKNYILDYFNKNEPTEQETNRVKTYLSFFKIEGTSIPDKYGEIKDLVAARVEVKNAVIEIIKKANSGDELEAKLQKIQQVWPDAIKPTYIRIENVSKVPLEIKDGERLDQLQGVEMEEAGKNYIVNIGGVLKPGASFVFHCVPVITDSDLAEVITAKSREIIKEEKDLMAQVDELESCYQEKLQFLKTGEKKLLTRIWQKITDNNNTPLTEENQNKYVAGLLDDYIEALESLPQKPFTIKYIKEKIQTHVEEIAKDLNSNFKNLLNYSDRQKTLKALGQKEKIDIGRVMLQWQFINSFREKYGKDNLKINSRYQSTGIGIISKMDYHAKNDPDFIHGFLGNMTKEQLNVLMDTFKNTELSKNETYEELLKKDWVGNLQEIGVEGRTVLRKAMLLNQVSTLVIHELAAYLNGTKDFNEALFHEHIDFICEHLPKKQVEANYFNDSRIMGQLKRDISTSLAQSFKDREELLIGDLEAVRDTIRMRSKESRVWNVAFKLNTLERDWDSISSEINHILAKLEKEIDSREIYGLLKKIDTINTLKDGPKGVVYCSPLAELARNIKNCCEELDEIKLAQKELGENDTSGLEFIIKLPGRTTSLMKDKLKEFILNIKETFSDRLGNVIRDLLSVDHLRTVKDGKGKLNHLSYSSKFTHLVKLVYSDSEDRKTLWQPLTDDSLLSADEGRRFSSSLLSNSLLNKRGVDIPLNRQPIESSEAIEIRSQKQGDVLENNAEVIGTNYCEKPRSICSNSMFKHGDQNGVRVPVKAKTEGFERQVGFNVSNS